MPSLSYRDLSNGAARSFELHKRITSVGSSPDNDLTLSDPAVEQTHALIQFDGRTFTLQALAPGGVTRVNRQKVRRTQLEHGDELEIGPFVLRFQLFDEPEAEEPAQQEERVLSYERLLEFSRLMLEEQDVEPLLERMMDAIIELTNADRGFLILRHSEELTVRVARNLERTNVDEAVTRYSDSIINTVVASRRPLIVSDALHDDVFSASRSVVNLRLCSVMCAPLLHRGELLGLIYVGNDNVVNLFTQAHLEALELFAAQASLIVRSALAMDELRLDNARLRDRIEGLRFGAIIGSCEPMQVIYRSIEKVAPTDVSVLIEGETGTGKELIARELHERSPRSAGPFVTINCGAIPEQLLESELFGHVKGAFTGATATRIGRFQAADGGTLFLDEIGEMPLHLQVRILRALQERVVTRVGDHRAEPVNIRIVAATNRDLEQLVREGSFREDLYYRLNVVRLLLPPLRERGEDIVLIARYLLDRFVRELQTPPRSLSPEAITALRRAAWPGNIRQLENHIKKAVVLAEHRALTPADLDLDDEPLRTIAPLQRAREQWQRRYVLEALALHGGNRARAARELEIDERTLYRYLERDADADASRRGDDGDGGGPLR